MYGILTYMWFLFLVNVGKYSSPMDGMGYMQCALEPRQEEEMVDGNSAALLYPLFLPFTGSWISDMPYYHYCFGV